MSAMREARGMQRDQAGFTLVELLVAFSILLVGMTGIITLFSTGLTLEREATLAMDSANSLEEIRAQVRDTLLRLAEETPGDELKIDTTDVPGRPGLSYTVDAIPMPGESRRQGFLVDIKIQRRGAKGDAFSYGYLPMRLAPDYEELVRKAASTTR